MNRIEFLMQGLDINEVQASLLSELISDIPNHQLKNFLVFRMKYIEPMMSKDLITKTALFEYRKMKILRRVHSGEKVFSTIEQVQNFLETYYKGKEIGYGLGSYYDFVVIGMDKDCNLLNKYVINEHGSYAKINGDGKAMIYNFLLERQERIGVVKYFTREEAEQKKQLIESKKEVVKTIDVKDKSINSKVMDMMKDKIKKI